VRNLTLKVITLLALLNSANAQFKTIELKPIQKHGLNYYYDFKKVTSPYALQIPLLAMEDDKINRYYNTFNGLQLVGGLVFAVPVLYAVYNITSNIYDPQTFWTMTVGALGVSMAMEIWSHNRMKLAIERYNLLLLPHPSGRNTFTGPSLSVGLSLN
jgi:hypothetical protein